jgi:hypothetical protein
MFDSHNMPTINLKPDKERKLRKIEDEIWKEIPDSEGRYMISNYGRVKSFVFDKSGGKIMRFSHIKNFFTINLRLVSGQKTLLVHKLVAEAFVSKTSDDCTHVIHLDWNTKNNYYKNLDWVSREVSYLRVSNFLREKNKNNPNKIITFSKLKAQDVKLIKSMLQRGVKQNLIAKMFCISEMQVTRIKRGENWGDIKVEAEAVAAK